MSKLRIGLFADGEWGVGAFNLLNSDPDIEIVFVVLRYGNPDKKLIELAKENNIKIYVIDNINKQGNIYKLALLKCDLFVSMSYDQIFKKDILEVPPLGIINCHAGDLPKYRGRNVLSWALRNDESSFGITVHYVDEGIDTGDIILQQEYKITDEDDYNTLLNKSERECPKLLYRAIKQIQRGEQKRQQQFSGGFYCTQLKRGDEKINWNDSSRDIFNLIRSACSPAGPSAFTILRGAEVRINKSRYLPNIPKYKGIPGAVVGIEDDGFLVKTGDSHLLIMEAEVDLERDKKQGKIGIGDRFHG